MKNLFVLLVILGLAAIPISRRLQANRFHVSSTHPLGELAAIQAHLEGGSFAQSKGEIDDSAYGEDLPDQLHGIKVWHYEDTGHKDDDGPYQGIDVAVDARGNVLGIGARVYSAHWDIGRQSAKSEHFIQAIWRDATGNDPHFVKTTAGGGAADKELLISLHKSGGLGGSWRKTSNSGTEKSSLYDTVLLYIEP